METVTFLVTGFTVTGSYRRGQVTFREPVQPSAPEFSALDESSRHCRCPFPVHVFPRASVELPEGDSSSNQQKALHEIDRVLDTFVFTDFGSAKYLPIGCVTTSAVRAIRAKETFVPMLMSRGLKPPVMPSYRTQEAEAFLAHTVHLIEKDSSAHTEAEQDSGSRGLPRTYCAPHRKGQFGSHGSRKASSSGATLVPTRSLARAFSESMTVAFVLEWLALETMLVTDPEERITDALRRIPKLMRYWPATVAFNYMPNERAKDASISEHEWVETVEEMYQDRKEIFHGREFDNPIDPSWTPSCEAATSLPVLEAILGRCVSFLGRATRSRMTLGEAWSDLDGYVPTNTDAPPTNLGGWTRSWV